tara:strand:- start:6444 stop:7013 length:570 start_codon:yes stop_codon:yes gene_type:complete
MKLFLNTKQIFFYLFTALLISSCSSDEDEVDEIPELINEEEVITTVVLTFDSSDNPTQTIRWAVEEDNSSKVINLKANTDYQVGISFLDETDPSDVEDITEEVIEEADEHQVFYDFSDVSISYSSGTNDTIDSDGNPVYLESLWTASSSGSGIVQAFLIHEPTTKTGTSRDSFGGETDVAIDIPITIVD